MNKSPVGSHNSCKSAVVNVMLLILTMGVVVILSELVCRMLIEQDADGNLSARGRVLKPYRYPKHRFQSYYEIYKDKVDIQQSPILVRYDQELGWNNNPSMDHYFNAQGLRNPGKLFSAHPRDDVFRIALFGDSFTQGRDVELEESWGYLIEQSLTTEGLAVEVLNFGVDGYGIDQIYLRWEKEVTLFNPDLIIFGFYPLDIGRSMEIHHMKNWALAEGGMGFSKPRFVLEANGALTLINSPTLTPEQLLAIDQFSDLPFMEHDAVYANTLEDYQSSPLRLLWVGRIIEEHLVNNRFTRLNYYQYDDWYDLETEGAQLTLRILEQFRDSVHARGAAFLIVHFPMHLDLYHLRSGRPLRYETLLDKLEQIAPVIKTHEDFLAYELDSLFVPGGHYSGLGNEIVARAVMAFLQEHGPDFRVFSESKELKPIDMLT